MQEHQKPKCSGQKPCRASSESYLFSALVGLLFSVFGVAAQPGYTIVKSFGFPDQSGEFPEHIFAGSDGAFYGAAALGRQWQPSAGNEWRGALFTAEDPEAPQLPQRFYRARLDN